MYHMIFPHTSGGEWRSPQIPRTFTKDEIEWGKNEIYDIQYHEKLSIHHQTQCQ